MNEPIDMLDSSTNRKHEATPSQSGDFGPVVLYQGTAITFVTFGLLVGVGAILGLSNIWFYLGSYQVLANSDQANQLAIIFALGTPISAYLVTRLLDFRSWISGEKSFIEYIRTVSFGLWGGLVGGLVMLTSFAYLTQTPVLSLLDAFAFGVPLAQVIGRLACLNYGCCHGKECSPKSHFGVRYFHPQSKVLRYDPKLKGKRLYPTQIYSVLANAFIYTIMLVVVLTWDSRPQGILVATYMTLYGVKRFNMEFLRGELPRVYFRGLTVWQWFSLFFVVLGLGIGTFALSNGSPITPFDFTLGLEGVRTALGMLILASTILALAFGTHGKKIGTW